MKYIIELKKDGRLRGEMLRASEEEAREIVREWESRGCGNSAEWHREEKVWIAIYLFGDLDCVIDDELFEERKEQGIYREGSDSWDWMLVRDGKFYESLSAAMNAEFVKYRI